jgi:hypothetical protein
VVERTIDTRAVEDLTGFTGRAGTIALDLWGIVSMGWDVLWGFG